MSLEETDTDDSGNSLSDVSDLDDDFARVQFESSSSKVEIADDGMNSQVWNEIEPESDAEFQNGYGLVEKVTSTSEDNTINAIDCYRHFISDEIITLMVCETNRYVEQNL